MEPVSERRSWTWKVLQDEVSLAEIELNPYVMRLRSKFGTSHSQTVKRTNALFTMRLRLEGGVATGVAEVGLPPKKAGIYESDFEDVVRVAAKFSWFVALDQVAVDGRPASLVCLENGEAKDRRSVKNASNSTAEDPFASLDECFFSELRIHSAFNSTFQRLLQSLDRCLVDEGTVALPTCAGIEVALLDCWSRIKGVPLHRTICPLADSQQRVSFYTVAMNEDRREMVASAMFGLQHTPFLKIKLGPCLQSNIQVLKTLYEEMEARGHRVANRSWSIDANACLDPEKALLLLEMMPAHVLLALFMIEQPFPHDLTRGRREAGSSSDLDGDLARWARVKGEWERRGVLVFADESVRFAEDIPPLVSVCSGVNLKLEKAGGIRGLIRAAQCARLCGLRVWIGCMVGSSLNSTISAHVLFLSDTACDLDGALLVQSDGERFRGGFRWSVQRDPAEEHIPPDTMAPPLRGAYGYVRLSRASGIGMVPLFPD